MIVYLVVFSCIVEHMYDNIWDSGQPPHLRGDRPKSDAVTANKSAVHIKCGSANVCTLSPSDFGPIDVDGHVGLFASARSEMLERDFSERQFMLIGIHESRLPQSTDRKGYFYHMISSAATNSGTLGVQLWVNLELKVSVLAQVPVQV